MELKQKACNLVKCIRLAKALGYEDVEYTLSGYCLMKHNRVAKNFHTTDEALQWLEKSLETNARASAAIYKNTNRAMTGKTNRDVTSRASFPDCRIPY